MKGIKNFGKIRLNEQKRRLLKRGVHTVSKYANESRGKIWVGQETLKFERCLGNVLHQWKIIQWQIWIQKYKPVDRGLLNKVVLLNPKLLIK
ncbi:MAG: hypothetical protein CM15mV53_270 [uncultured marine virus]|nr:MAG: hypothetical protein CM15mV53_270 [uncultured marine virus]